MFKCLFAIVFSIRYSWACHFIFVVSYKTLYEYEGEQTNCSVVSVPLIQAIHDNFSSLHHPCREPRLGFKTLLFAEAWCVNMNNKITCESKCYFITNAGRTGSRKDILAASICFVVTASPNYPIARGFYSPRRTLRPITGRLITTWADAC